MWCSTSTSVIRLLPPASSLSAVKPWLLQVCPLRLHCLFCFLSPLRRTYRCLSSLSSGRRPCLKVITLKGHQRNRPIRGERLRQSEREMRQTWLTYLGEMFGWFGQNWDDDAKTEYACPMMDLEMTELCCYGNTPQQYWWIISAVLLTWGWLDFTF